jgi:integrase/recombinase XerD
LVAVHAPGVSLTLPDLIGRAGEAVAFRTLEFFTSCTPNPHTRGVYARAVRDFCGYGAGFGVDLRSLSSPTVAAWVQSLIAEGRSAATVNAKLSGVRQWLDWLARHGAIAGNPAAPVKGIRRSVREGKTPILERDEARRLLESIAGMDVVSLRDKAILGVMLFGGVRVTAVCKMRLRDFEEARDGWLVLHEKGGRERRIPCHHLARDYLRAYVPAAGIVEKDAPLFQGAPGHADRLSGEAMSRQGVLAMVKRRCADAGLPGFICNHSFRATGATIALENGARLEDVQELLGHAHPGTTQLYNRKTRHVARTSVEHIQVF